MSTRPEERSAIEDASQRIGCREPDELALHRRQPLGRPQPGVELFGHRRLADKVIGPAIESLGERC